MTRSPSPSGSAPALGTTKDSYGNENMQAATSTIAASNEIPDIDFETERDSGAGDQQFDHGESGEDTIPRGLVEEWLLQACSAIDRLDVLQESTKQLRALIGQFPGVGVPSVGVPEMKGLARREIMSDTESIVSSTETEPLQGNWEVLTDQLIPEIRYKPWKDTVYGRRRTGKYYSIEIPLNEPTHTDIMLISKEDPISQDKRNPGPDQDHPPRPERLPERIRISSQRLGCFLGYEFANGSLAFGAGYSDLSILRPFKLLIYLDKQLRARVQALEKLHTEFQQGDLSHYDEKTAIHTDWIRGNWKGTPYDLKDLTGILKDCRCLFEFIDKQLIPEQTRLAAGPETVRFSDLWFLFPQGSLVYVKDSSVPQKIWKVIQASGGRRAMSGQFESNEYQFPFTSFQLDCYYLDHNGTCFVQSQRTFQINEFDGEQPVVSLSVLPFIVAERDTDLVNKQALLERGRQFVQCTQKVSHLEFSGRSQYLTPNGEKLADLADGAQSALCFSERIEGEVMVDFPRALQAVPGWRIESDIPKVTSRTEQDVLVQTGVDKDYRWQSLLSDQFLEPEGRKWLAWRRGNGIPVEDDDLLLLPDRVFAFVLPSRRWACLQIGKAPDGKDHLREREPEDNPWEKLQLPPGHKNLVQSLILSHFAKPQSAVQFDLLKNKGNGVIILLHGVPGVGKTSTAECAAISNRKPLLPITCGDLGLTPKEVEDKLKEIFRLAQEWGCVMLLDEADVFLAQRSATDTTRNALVSVFLRTLEYYEGILFLTTNRVGVFDEAFRSRIHMSLYYPSLERMQTVRIWERHIQEAAKAGIHVDGNSLVDLADKIYEIQKNSSSGAVWNGRQIRNAFQSALALAAFHSQGGPVSLERRYFENVFEVSDQFSSYIWTTKNYQTDADRNRLGLIRRDDFRYQSISTGEATLLQQRQYGGLESTYGQRAPQSSSNLGAQKLQHSQRGPMSGLSSYPVHAQRLDNIQAAGMRQLNTGIPSTEEDYHQPTVRMSNSINLQAVDSTALPQEPNQPLQYPLQQAIYGTHDSRLVTPPTRDAMFAPSQAKPRS
ncbi:hypothetical protein EYB26_003700 [Talaromyces marneffei]|uniref:uncharacterized protein n=1 Tax=Talaromyces marneffei TaxID=37727 RepID=UPI0012A8F4D5|nr:uncharacterized protein EYB26_003700 [Talaromyces marneffei]QGA16033.1 hypothetical protein EYB26_003700 [Talaromyces marneffei]